MDTRHAGKSLLSILIVLGLSTQALSSLQAESDPNYVLNTLELHNLLNENETETDNRDRIVGGVEVEPGEFPYVVSLKYRSTSRHFCGGSLLSLQHVLTACHCLVKYGSNRAQPDIKPPKSIEVYAGDLGIDGFGKDVQYQRGKKTVIYPFCKKNITGWHYDLGILITKPFKRVESTIELVPLPDFPNRTMLRNLIIDGGGITCHAIGWGSIYFKGPPAKNLMKVKLEMKTQTMCKSLINYYAKTHGYSGVTMVLGVVSWGFGCGEAVPAVYARIDESKLWLENVLQDDKAALGSRSLTAISLIFWVCLLKQFA